MIQTQLIPASLRNAFFSYRIAENEYNRPIEDAVTLCACNKMRGSVEEFLRSFLRHNDAAFNHLDYFNDLLNRCANIDSQFKAIDLSCFVCNNEGGNGHEKYCFSAEKMKDCFIQTRMVKNLVLAKLNLSEKDFE